MSDLSADILVIGAGSGGLSVAAGAAQMGADVILLEKGEMGGDCLNYGCVPSKALISVAKAAHAQAHPPVSGVAPHKPQVDYAKAMGHVKQSIAAIAPHDSQERFESLGVRVIRAAGRFLDEKHVQAGEAVIAARRIVVATGSSPFVPPIPGLADVPYLTNETLWSLRECPEHLIVIGGGPIGLEMAQTHRRLGAKVTVLEAAQALAKDDPELAAIVLARIRAEGVDLYENTAATSVSGSEGAITVETSDGARHMGTHLLVAVGRRANTHDLNLEAAGIETTKTGIKVDAALRSTNRRVFAIGDVAGGLQFTHVSGYHASVIVRAILLGLPSKARQDHIPWVSYTAPELAQVGLTEAEARERYGEKIEVIRYPFSGVDRAIAEGLTEGLIKLIVHRGRPLGVSIAGPQAGELIGIWALAMATGLKMSKISTFIAPYPTLNDISKRAIGTYFSPRLFDSLAVKRLVRFVQRWIP